MLIQRVARWLFTKEIDKNEYQVVDVKKLEKFREHTKVWSDEALCFFHGKVVEELEEFVRKRTDKQGNLRIGTLALGHYYDLMRENLAMVQEKRERGLPVEIEETGERQCE